jgi:hypothetical protein
MKKHFALFLLISISLFGCKKLDKFTKFNLEYNESVSIPATLGVNLPFNIYTPDVSSNSEASFSANNTRKDLIEEIKLTQLDLTITSPTNGNFNFLKTIEVYISADGLSELKIASKENIPNTMLTNLALDISNVDLKEYLKKDKFKLRLYTTKDQAVTNDYQINVHSKFFVDAKILGQ